MVYCGKQICFPRARKKGKPMNYRNYVNILQGTASVPEFSHGNILPIVARPFGMNHFALDTRGQTHNLFFHPTDTFTTGVRLTHMPSPWIGDYGYFRMIAASGNDIGARLGDECRSSYTLSRTLMKPWELKIALQLFRCEMDLIPTTRGAILEMNWEDDTLRRFCLSHGDQHATIALDPSTRTVSGYTTYHTWPMHENFKMFYVIRFDTDFDLAQSKITGGDLTLAEGKNLSLNLAFAGEGRQVRARLATSFISPEQAERNLLTEVEGKTVQELRALAEKEWEARLALIEIEADEDVMKTFYTCLYRMMLYPRIFHEYDADGKPYHYSPEAGKAFEGVFYTDNGFWDTYKTVYPLYSLIMREDYVDMCRGFVNFYRESGWLPRWMSPGAVNCMPGTAIDAVFGDAAVKGVVTDRALLEQMLQSTMQHVKNPSADERFGRDGVEGFLRLGYVTSDHKESVNKTQDYAYGNFCVAQIAKALGEDKLAEDLIASSLNYRNLFDRETGFLRAKDANGNMRSDWNCFQWGGDYTEGSAWQNSLAMFHDFGGMARCIGGRDAMLAHLDRLFATKPDFDIYGYGFEIHEMLEMAAVDFGQCAISNQPSFHIPYLYSYLGRPEKTAYWVRKMMAELFNDGPCGYPGDEDNGSMGGWYVFSALGFYPVCPGTTEYVVGSPAVRRAVIHVGDKPLVITANDQSKDSVYVSSVTVDGTPIHRTYLTQDELVKGGAIVFEMSAKAPNDRYSDDQLPYSVER